MTSRPDRTFKPLTPPFPWNRRPTPEPQAVPEPDEGDDEE